MRGARDTSTHASRGGTDAPHASPLALARYAAGWVATAAVAAALGLLAVRTISPSSAPLRRVDPIAAVRDRCVLRRTGSQRPPVSGGPAAPAAAGVYSRTPTTMRLVGALRRGVVVVQYRSTLPRRQVDELRVAFGDVGVRRIVTPDASAMPYLVAGTAWERVLGCRRLDAAVFSALARFASSYQGRGPDAQRP